jgi:hypothetical protein
MDKKIAMEQDLKSILNQSCKTVLLALSLLSISVTVTAQKKHKAVFVIADGIPADLLEELAMPNLMAITRTGGYARAHVGGEKGGYSETPTIRHMGKQTQCMGQRN